MLDILDSILQQKHNVLSENVLRRMGSENKRTCGGKRGNTRLRNHLVSTLLLNGIMFYYIDVFHSFASAKLAVPESIR